MSSLLRSKFIKAAVRARAQVFVNLLHLLRVLTKHNTINSSMLDMGELHLPILDKAVRDGANGMSKMSTRGLYLFEHCKLKQIVEKFRSSKMGVLDVVFGTEEEELVFRFHQAHMLGVLVDREKRYRNFFGDQLPAGYGHPQGKFFESTGPLRVTLSASRPDSDIVEGSFALFTQIEAVRLNTSFLVILGNHMCITNKVMPCLKKLPQDRREDIIGFGCSCVPADKLEAKTRELQVLRDAIGHKKALQLQVEMRAVRRNLRLDKVERKFKLLSSLRHLRVALAGLPGKPGITKQRDLLLAQRKLLKKIGVKASVVDATSPKKDERKCLEPALKRLGELLLQVNKGEINLRPPALITTFLTFRGTELTPAAAAFDERRMTEHDERVQALHKSEEETQKAIEKKGSTKKGSTKNKASTKLTSKVRGEKIVIKSWIQCVSEVCKRWRPVTRLIRETYDGAAFHCADA